LGLGDGVAYGVRFDELGSGRIVRMLDGLYRVDGIGTFTRVKPLSKGLKPVPGTVGLPIGARGWLGGKVYPERYSGFSIKSITTGKNGRPEVTFSIRAQELNYHGARREQTVQEGDIVWLGCCGHRVKKIMPGKLQKNLIGWVDIDPRIAGLRGPASFRLEKEPAPEGFPFAPLGGTGYWVNASSKKDNFEGISIVLNGGNVPGLFDHARDHRYHVTFRRLKVGDAVRLLDGVYRLADDRGLFKRIPDEQLPENARPAPHSYGIPFNGRASLHKRMLNVLAWRKWNRVLRRTAVVKKNRFPETGEIVFKIDVNKVTVNEGDLLWIGKYAHRVIQVVPPNPERNLPGWVDIEQKVAKTKQEKAKDGNQ